MPSSPVRRLPDDLVNKIAAGEVVERPASVVKELVENAVDAAARQVNVAIEAGGKRLIRVVDDGHGMSRQDAEAALERHATSKLSQLSDLEAIATHGFRGEALPSIASVSHLVLRTRDEVGPAGTEIEVRHGRLVGVRDVGHPRGTTVEVSDLFGDVPARRKFLRADSTESGHVAEALSLLALARPDVGFKLTSGKREIIVAPPVADREQRLYQLQGRALLDRLVPVSGEQSWVGVSGFVARPQRSGPARGSLRLFVNGRPVRDRALSRAVSEAYRLAGAGDRRPDGFVFVEVPLHMVDVNVHPAKTEVRFADGRTVFLAVEETVRRALSRGAVAEAVSPQAAMTSGATSWTPMVAEAVEGYLDRAAEGATGGHPSGGSTWPLGASAPLTEASTSGSEAQSVVAPDLPRILGQHRGTYIVASDGEDLLLVDQHTAHERVRFEAIVARMAEQKTSAQRLLVPAVADLPPELLALVEEQAENLYALGFEVDAFGGGSVRLSTVPAELGVRDPGPALVRLLRDALEAGSTEWAVSGARERLAATLACHSAARAGDPLRPESMTAILEGLRRTEHPTLCPHGRPTMKRIPHDDVARWFGRTGWRRS